MNKNKIRGRRVENNPIDEVSGYELDKAKVAKLDDLKSFCELTIVSGERIGSILKKLQKEVKLNRMGRESGKSLNEVLEEFQTLSDEEKKYISKKIAGTRDCNEMTNLINSLSVMSNETNKE